MDFGPYLVFASLEGAVLAATLSLTALGLVVHYVAHSDGPAKPGMMRARSGAHALPRWGSFRFYEGSLAEQLQAAAVAAPHMHHAFVMFTELTIRVAKGFGTKPYNTLRAASLCVLGMARKRSSMLLAAACMTDNASSASAHVGVNARTAE